MDQRERIRRQAADAVEKYNFVAIDGPTFKGAYASIYAYIERPKYAGGLWNGIGMKHLEDFLIADTNPVDFASLIWTYEEFFA